MDRNKSLERIKERASPWDIVVIGGGATGVGCALDAASRGLDVMLVEQDDFGSGTSSRSTKLIHGGVRYLRQGNISLVREALRERAFLLKNAPHVVHVRQFIVPCYGMLDRVLYGIGLKIYDLLAGKRSIGSSRLLSRNETIDRSPTVKTEGLVGGVLYMDGQFDDTRLLVDMVMTASQQGACLVNYLRVENLVKETDGVTGVSLRDAISGELFKIGARSVINATGAYCDPIRQMSEAAVKPVVTFARGSHIVLDRKFLPADAALMIPKTSDGRVLFCIPWLDHLLIGTTDVPCETTELGQIASDEEVDFLLETAGDYLTKRPRRSDILSKFAGVRPLVSDSYTKNTASLSRSHELFVDNNGLVSVTGGKWTTYRKMAEEAVNKAVEIGKLPFAACRTETLCITPSPAGSGERLHRDLPYTRNDIIRGVREEMAQTVEDVLARRTRALFLNAQAARELAPMVAEILKIEVGRNESQIAEDLIKFDIISKRYLAAL